MRRVYSHPGVEDFPTEDLGKLANEILEELDKSRITCSMKGDISSKFKHGFTNINRLLSTLLTERIAQKKSMT